MLTGPKAYTQGGVNTLILNVILRKSNRGKYFRDGVGISMTAPPPSGSAHEVGAKKPMLPLRGPWGQEATSPAAFRAYSVP